MRRGPPQPLFGRPARRIHCLGVGGMGMAPLAIYLAQCGYAVSGEDDALAGEVKALLDGAGVAVGPLPEDCDLVAYSSAIPPAHPVYAAASARRLPLVRRGELLAEVARGLKLVAVCGAHGKTTTTAMLVTALRRANFPAGYVLGGLFDDGELPARAGSNDWLVAEVDESEGTIDLFSPEITVAVNLDWDHPDFYPTAAAFEAAFASLFRRTASAVLVSDTCPASLRATLGTNAGEEVSRRRGLQAASSAAAAAEGAAPKWVFGRTGDYRGEITQEEGERMVLRLGGRFEGADVRVRARGEFNAANATAALAAAQLMGAAPGESSLADYPGVRRRQRVLYERAGLTVIEDYAHHPTEIRALLGSLRRRVRAGGRLIAVFQPHRYSRTARFKGEFAAALALADAVVLLDVYGAGEAPIAGGTTADIYAALKQGAPALPVTYLPGGGLESFRNAGAPAATAAPAAPVDALCRRVSLQMFGAKIGQPGDLVAFVGAGDIDRMARSWLDELRAEVRRMGIWDEFAESVRPRLGSETKLRREEPLAAKTTIRVGGKARLYAEPANVDDLRLLLREASGRGLPVFMLGRGSNLIIPDEGVDGLVVALSHPWWSRCEVLPEGRLRAGAGLRLKNLCGIAARAGLGGFEFLEGIPGSVGGSLKMNAGAMGGWIFDVVEEIEVMDEAGTVKTLARAEMHVDYRHCAELHHAIALSAVLRPDVKIRGMTPSSEISRQIDAYRSKRHETQPREPSAGCIFKNPPGNSAGRLIEESGLKGERVGDAEVSPVHANFIVNRGHATGGDVIGLVRLVREEVRRAKGVTLEPEALLYGGSWEEVL